MDAHDFASLLAEAPGGLAPAKDAATARFIRARDLVRRYFPEPTSRDFVIGTLAKPRKRDVPDELGQKGVANPRVRRSADRDFKRMLKQYESYLTRYVSGYLEKKQKYAKVKRAVKATMDQFFEMAYLNGMRRRAGRKTTPKQFTLRGEHNEWVRKAVAREFGYFEKFMDDLRYKRHTKPRKKNWERRVKDYAGALQFVRHAGEAAATPQDFWLIHWEVDPAAESCPGCLYLGRLSPFPRDLLPTTPRAGETACRMNCKCELIPRRSTEAQVQQRRIVLPSKGQIERELQRLMNRGPVKVRR